MPRFSLTARFQMVFSDSTDFQASINYLLLIINRKLGLNC